MSECDGKTALVTDGSRGVGKATAIALARAGAQVLIHYDFEAAQAAQVVSEIRSFGGKADTVSVSISSPDGPQDLAHRTRAIVGDRLDILVLNCTSCNEAPLEAMTVQELDSQLTTNVRAPMFVVQQLLPILSNGSSIVFTHAAPPKRDDTPAHAVTKGAIQALVPHLASVLAPRGIRVNEVATSAIGRRRHSDALLAALRSSR
jgi:NAD(P)-dependent dehydrogenase (short-subunit alcohol dehydrogenase family)